jgi:hypothetical protein
MDLDRPGELHGMSVADFAHAVAAFLGINKEFQGLGPLWGAIFGAIITSAVVHSRTTRHQEANALFEFAKRFHDLLDRAHALARDHVPAADGPTPEDRSEAGAYYRKLFDLMLNEYTFYRKGLVSRGSFYEWMTWRWGAWRGLEGATVVVRGVTYQEAWRAWSSRPLMRTNPFVQFTDRIHTAADLKEVARLVDRHAPRWWSPWA